MMKVWVMQGSYEAELFSSVHLTEKGCALACISDVLDFHDIDSEEDAQRVVGDCYGHTKTDGKQTHAFEWDREKMKNMTSKELWKIFGEWCDISWDIMSDRSYYIDAQSMEVQA